MLHTLLTRLTKFQRMCLLVLAFGVLLLGGCVDTSQLAALRDQAVAVRDELRTEASRLQADAGVEEIDPAMRDAADDAAAVLNDRLNHLDQAIAALDTALQSSQTPDELFGRLASQAAPFLPEPIRSPVLLLGALAAALFRASQLKRAAGSIAHSVAKAAEKDDEFRSAIQRHADTLRSVQTPTAKRIVDERVREGFMLRLPV